MVVYIPLGDSCSPAHAVKGLGLRVAAYPFDWISGSTESIVNCILTDFKEFHTGLYPATVNPHIGTNTVLIDALGFKFHHDYPTTKNQTWVDDEQVHSEEWHIVDNWADSYPSVYEKYQRRIQRFRAALSGPEPVVGICRRSVDDCRRIQNAIKQVYHCDIIIVTACKTGSSDPMVITCDPEENGKWDDVDVWRRAFERLPQPRLALSSHGFVRR
jgi:hypothetical protein